MQQHLSFDSIMLVILRNHHPAG